MASLLLLRPPESTRMLRTRSVRAAYVLAAEDASSKQQSPLLYSQFALPPPSLPNCSPMIIRYVRNIFRSRLHLKVEGITGILLNTGHIEESTPS